ncbi:unnamed protein product, partial [Ectocarpus sp. 8 AP-2014]
SSGLFHLWYSVPSNVRTLLVYLTRAPYVVTPNYPKNGQTLVVEIKRKIKSCVARGRLPPPHDTKNGVPNLCLHLLSLTGFLTITSIFKTQQFPVLPHKRTLLSSVVATTCRH